MSCVTLSSRHGLVKIDYGMIYYKEIDGIGVDEEDEHIFPYEIKRFVIPFSYNEQNNISSIVVNHLSDESILDAIQKDNEWLFSYEVDDVEEFLASGITLRRQQFEMYDFSIYKNYLDKVKNICSNNHCSDVLIPCIDDLLHNITGYPLNGEKFWDQLCAIN